MITVKKSIILCSWVFLLICIGTAFAAAPTGPGPKDRCSVCGMFVAPYPNWVAMVEFKDGSSAFFDGPKDMFIYFFDLPQYKPATTADDIAAMYVTEYYTTRLLNVKEVFLVTGSDVMGPMGQELVPVEGKENAETFLRDHGGKKIMQFDGLGLSEIFAEQ